MKKVKIAKRVEILDACEQFIEILGDRATHLDLFYILARVAEQRGLELRAEQQGIRGTFIYFTSTLRKKEVTK